MLNYQINAGSISVLFTFSHNFHYKVCSKHFDKKFPTAKNLSAKRKKGNVYLGFGFKPKYIFKIKLKFPPSYPTAEKAHTI